MADDIERTTVVNEGAPGWISAALVVLGLLALTGIGFGWKDLGYAQDSAKSLNSDIQTMRQNYDSTLSALRGGAALEPALRLFEKHLLEVLGYGLDLRSEAHGGRPIEADGFYEFRADTGLLRAGGAHSGALCGRALLALAAEELEGERVLEDARRLLKCALSACLEGRTLATREVAKAMVRKVAP